MSPLPIELSDLFAFARETFNRLVSEFATYGLRANPGLELREGNGLLCYCDLTDGNLYVSIPKPADAAGKLHALFLRSLIGCRDNAQMARFLQLLLPWGIAHELAHHYRREQGLFGANLWEEEQLANRLASAAIKHRLSPEDWEELRALLEQAIETLSRQGASLDLAVDSADNLLQALNVSGEIGPDDARNIEVMGRIFRVTPEELIRAHEHLSANVIERLARRDNLIGAFNEEYGSDVVKYMFCQLGWIFLSLCGREQHYVDEFVRDGLHLTTPLLAKIEHGRSEPEDGDIQACFAAHHYAAGVSATASRYFYKRYRTLLLDKVVARDDSFVDREVGSVLEQWEEGDYETLNMARRFAPARLHGLFPMSIASGILPPSDVESRLGCSTDRRLWLHVMGKDDEAAAHTLERIAILEQTPLFRPLPADVLLELSHSLCRILIPAKEPIIWEGRANDDIYILTRGRLSVSKRHGGADVTAACISPGEVFGEMAFLTQRPRSATVRAVEDSECLLVKACDLRLLAYRQPSVLMQIARVLAERLEAR
jgi:Cyclic nucleotide-binding domain